MPASHRGEREREREGRKLSYAAYSVSLDIPLYLSGSQLFQLQNKDNSFPILLWGCL